jgi:hypothetical protein
MSNRPHKKEKAKKRSNGYFVKKAVPVGYSGSAAVHEGASEC